MSRTVKGREREDKEWTPRGDPMERERDQGCALKEGREVQEEEERKRRTNSDH